MKKDIFNTIVPDYYKSYSRDKFLQSQLKEYSRTRIQNLIDEGRVKVNNILVKDISFFILDYLLYREFHSSHPFS